MKFLCLASGEAKEWNGLSKKEQDERWNGTKSSRKRCSYGRTDTKDSPFTLRDGKPEVATALSRFECALAGLFPHRRSFRYRI